MTEDIRNSNYEQAYDVLCKANDSTEHLLIWDCAHAAKQAAVDVVGIREFLNELTSAADSCDAYRNDCADILNANLPSTERLSRLSAVQYRPTRYSAIIEPLHWIKTWIKLGFDMPNDVLSPLLEEITNMTRVVRKFAQDLQSVLANTGSFAEVQRALDERIRLATEQIQICFYETLPRTISSIRARILTTPYEIMDPVDMNDMPSAQEPAISEQIKRQYEDNIRSMLYGQYSRFQVGLAPGWRNNCMFESLSLGLFGSTCRATELRYRTIVEIVNEESYFDALTNQCIDNHPNFYRKMVHAAKLCSPSYEPFLRCVATLTKCNIFVAKQDYYDTAETSANRGPRGPKRHAIYGQYKVAPVKVINRQDQAASTSKDAWVNAVAARAVYLAKCDLSLNTNAAERNYVTEPSDHFISLQHEQPMVALHSDFNDAPHESVAFKGLKVNGMELDDYSSVINQIEDTVLVGLHASGFEQEDSWSPSQSPMVPLSWQNVVSRVNSPPTGLNQQYSDEALLSLITYLKRQAEAALGLSKRVLDSLVEEISDLRSPQNRSNVPFDFPNWMPNHSQRDSNFDSSMQQ